MYCAVHRRCKSHGWYKSGLIALLRDVAPQVIWTHCMLHREALVAKDMSTELSDVMDSVVKVVNIVKKSALQTRLFSNLCAAEEEEHTALLYHSEAIPFDVPFDGFRVEQCCHVCWNYASLSGSFYCSKSAQSWLHFSATMSGSPNFHILLTFLLS